jgi:hypothetical protein
MSGAEIVALASVLVTGIATPFITSLTARRQLALQSRRDREDELRNVLEQAGIRLTEAMFAVNKARARPSEFQESDLRLLTQHLEQLWKNDDRLPVRLGSRASEVQHYRRAITGGLLRPTRSLARSRWESRLTTQASKHWLRPAPPCLTPSVSSMTPPRVASAPERSSETPVFAGSCRVAGAPRQLRSMFATLSSRRT